MKHPLSHGVIIYAILVALLVLILVSIFKSIAVMYIQDCKYVTKITEVRQNNVLLGTVTTEDKICD